MSTLSPSNSASDTGAPSSRRSSRRAHANVSLRIDDALAESLEKERIAKGLRSTSAVIEERIRRLLPLNLSRHTITLVRQPEAPCKTLALRADIVEQVRELAEANAVNIGVMVYSMVRTTSIPTGRLRFESLQPQSLVA